MSLDALRWAFKCTTGRASAKSVLVSLADRADETHHCFPSINRLARDTELNRKTVIAQLEYLEACGFIAREKTHGRVNHYRLVGVECRHANTGETTSPENGTSTKNGTGETHSTDGLTSTENGTSTNIGTSTETGTGPVPKTGLHQSQKRDTNLSLTNQEPQPASQTIARDWEPGSLVVAELENLHGVDFGFIGEQVTEFRAYWVERGEARSSWDSVFVKRCLAEWRLKGAEWSQQHRQQGVAV